MEEEDQERRKGANAVATSTTFAPVIAAISSGGAGGALVPWRQVVPPGPLAEAPGNPRPLSGRSLTGHTLSSSSQASAQTPGRSCFLAPRSIYILIKSGFIPPGSLA